MSWGRETLRPSPCFCYENLKFAALYCDVMLCFNESYSKEDELILKEAALWKGPVTLLCPMWPPWVLGAKWETGAGETSRLSAKLSNLDWPNSAVIADGWSRPTCWSWLGLVWFEEIESLRVSIGRLFFTLSCCGLPIEVVLDLRALGVLSCSGSVFMEESSDMRKSSRDLKDRRSCNLWSWGNDMALSWRLGCARLSLCEELFRVLKSWFILLS